jgi:hypothetical protein
MEVPAAVAKIMLLLGEHAHRRRIRQRRHVEPIGDKILGHRIAEVRLVLDNDNPRAQCGLASAIGGK